MKSKKPQVMPCLIYPGLMGSMVTLHLLMSSNGFEVTISTYTPILLAAAVVTVLERVMPYRRDWRPGRSEVGTDLLYMTVVQLALPKMLTLGAGLYVVQKLNSLQIVLDIWPHTRSMYVQAPLLILSISLVRYWVHRAGHEWPLLWRLHAVHHSVNKLYWVNLGRFHPLEETLRFLTESLPFIVLGVQEEALSLYFVLLSVNGFLFHSNILLKHGILNYLFATAELHRWHHAQDPHVAACNYGNLLIIWDTLFGTRYLPSSREVGTLGLTNKAYPQGFAAQLVAPFIPGIGRHDVPLARAVSSLRHYRGKVR